MTETTPRATLRSMLQGECPPRPLLAPVVFALGARLENLSPREYLSNPTKIANALRQIRNVLGLDGVTCYFDPYLEAEALGGELRWNTDGSLCELVPGIDWRDRLESPEQVVQGGRIPIARDVIQRLKVMLPAEPLLMAAVTGPCTLIRLLSSETVDEPRELNDAIPLAAGVTAALSKLLLEAGANLIFIRENFAPGLDGALWAESLSPIANVIRFYEALPVMVPDGALPPDAISGQRSACDGLVWPVTVEPTKPLAAAILENAIPTLALPGSYFSPEQSDSDSAIAHLPAGARGKLGLITSDGDISAGADLKYLATALGKLREIARAVA